MFRSFVKWSALVFVVVLVTAVAVSLATRKTFRVEITIPAPPEAVWEVLIDTAAYPEWNPVFIEVDGAYVQGHKVLNKVRDPSGAVLEMTATVDTLVPSAELRQSGGLPGVLTFDHRWLLEPVEGGTRVIQHEVDRGLGLWFWNSEWIEPSYAQTNEALAERVRNKLSHPDE